MLDFLDLSLPTITGNLALDEALLLEAEAGRSDELLRIWRWPRPAVVLGAAGNIADDVDVGACSQDEVPVVRRASGGGTVLLGRGCLCFSLVLKMDQESDLTKINASYSMILSRVARALAPIQSDIRLHGTSDLAIHDRKFSGNAQQRKRRYLLHHGTVLHAFDLSLFSRYLKLPPRRPDYRGERPHEEFVVNLPDRPKEIVEALRTEWKANRPLDSWPKEQVQKLLIEKYELDEWIRRR
jgi:lipoate-protein ligase A